MNVYMNKWCTHICIQKTAIHPFSIFFFFRFLSFTYIGHIEIEYRKVTIIMVIKKKKTHSDIEQTCNLFSFLIYLYLWTYSKKKISLNKLVESIYQLQPHVLCIHTHTSIHISYIYMNTSVCSFILTNVKTTQSHRREIVHETSNSRHS